ncbi:MAG: TonB-dependent receptor [Calditrichaeota bacterium]|nr:MAG: TonB-dependent receptor [Calditrichota bacterium]
MNCMNRFNLMCFNVLFLILSLFCVNNMPAGTTGKISGVVIDKKSGQVLPGANVIVAGTSMGAATNVDGHFLIINLAPGTYTLRVSMIGYRTANITEIRVFTDRSVKVTAELEETVIEGEEVTVVAEREAVEFDRTNTASYVGQEEIDALPVSTMSEIVQLQAGVIADAGGALHFRGGRSREVAYLIDGVPVTNTFNQGGGSNVNIENNFIKELQVISGTFNAEYGSAQSGIINIVTKVPENKFATTFDAIIGGYYSPNKPQYIGLDTYDPTDETELKFSFSGPLPFPQKLGKLGFYVNGRIVDSKGWLNGEQRYRPEDGWEIEVYREWYRAAFDPDDPLVIPLPDSLHTGNGEIDHMEWDKTININTKLVYQPKPSLTLAYNIFYSTTEGQGYSNSWRFAPEGMITNLTDNMTHLVVLTHAPMENLFYSLRYSLQENNDKDYMYEDPLDPRYQTTAVNAWDPGLNTGYDFGGIASWNRHWFDQSINLVNGDITWQLNNVLEIKTGFEAKKYHIHYKNSPMREMLGYETLQFPYLQSEIIGLELTWEHFRDATRDYEYGNLRLRETHADSAADDQFYVDYDRYPVEAAGYFQTTLSMGEIIFNGGLRLDVFQPKDRYAPDYSIVFPEFVGADEYYKQAKDKYQLSPRFGLSFPISAKGALRLSYGHFFQTPSYEKMYENPVLRHYNQFSIANTTIGNPNLKPEKTIQYEIGLQQELADGVGMELSVFYKDIRDLLGLEILTLSNATTFSRYINKEYGNSSGVTMAFDYRASDGKFNAGIDYTYMVAKGTASSPNAAVDVQILSGPGKGAYTLATKRINFLNWDQTHSLNGSASWRPAPSWNFTMLGQFGSGLPYSPATLNPSITVPSGWWDNTGRKPLRWTVDLKALKTFKYSGMRWGIYANVFNLFNHLDENTVNSITGQAGPAARLPEQERLRNYRIEQLGEFTLDEANYNPAWYSRPRLIQFGLNFEF